MSRLSIASVAVLLAVLVPPAYSQIVEMYRWTDEQGIVHFTNNLKEIPESFRPQATLMRRSESRPAEVPLVTNKASIQFQKRGDLMVVKAMLNDKLPVSFVVDTGASYTTISQAAAREAGIEVGENPTVLSFHTANGVIQAPLANVRSLEVGGLELKNITVAIHDVFPDSAVAGLLGINFLNQFRLDIDSQAGLLN